MFEIYTGHFADLIFGNTAKVLITILNGQTGSVLISIAAVLFIAYSTLGLILYFMQPVFLYNPVREVVYTPGELGLDFEKVVFKSADNLKLSGWFVPAKHSRFTILFCHGNCGNMTYYLDSINLFYNMGLNCFIFDYRGYGDSHGKPTEEGTYLDAIAAYKWLTEQKKLPAGDIIIFGRSLGGSIAAQLASKVKVRALIIESVFTSYADIGKKFYPYMPVRWFARFRYNTISYVRKVRCPIMIVHSRSDEIVPFEFGLEVYEAANEPKEFIEIFGSHNDGFLVSSEIYKKAWTKWMKFLKEHKTQTVPELV